MNFREITVGDLPDFIRSEEYRKLQPNPITPLRAISQSKNPHARKTDVALVFAAENDTLLAFAGLLPHLGSDTSEPLFSNSGWWIDPKLGRKLGLPVFLKAFQCCNQRMVFTDCSPYTKSILEKTGLFTFLPSINGNRFFLRFYLGDLLRKKGKGRLIISLFSFTDKILNTLFDLRFRLLLNKKTTKKYTVTSHTSLHAEQAEFIEKHPGCSFLKQDRIKLNWIVKNPWVTSEKEEKNISYPFTYRVENFHQEFLEIKSDTETIAILLLSIRDNHASVPFIYFKKELLTDITDILLSRLVQYKANSFVIFHPEVLEALKKKGKIWLFQKKISRFAGYSKEFHSIFVKHEYLIQDGDGDTVFT